MDQLAHKTEALVTKVNQVATERVLGMETKLIPKLSLHANKSAPSKENKINPDPKSPTGNANKTTHL